MKWIIVALAAALALSPIVACTTEVDPVRACQQDPTCHGKP